MKKAANLILLGIATLLAASPAHAQSLPVEAFGKLPPFNDITLSPDGSKAVALRAIGDTYHVVLLDFTTGKSRLLMAADPDNFLYNWCRFANDTRIVCSIRSYLVLRAGDIGTGFRAYRDGRTVARRLLAIDITGKNQLQLVPEARSRLGGDIEWNAVDQDTVISWMEDDPRHILIQLNREDRLRPSVYKLNIYNNKMQRKQGFLQSVLRWYADEKGALRFAVGRRQLEPVAYSLHDGKREALAINGLMGLEEPRVLAISETDDSLWVRANNGKDTQGVYRVSTVTGEVLESLFHHDSYDVSRFYYNPATGRPTHVAYQADSTEYVWFDKTLQQHMAALKKATGHPKQLTVTNTDRDFKRVVLYAEGNGTDPAYYLYTLQDRALVKLAQWHQGPPVEFQAMSYTARDGLKIPAYVALPGPADEGPYPTVIRPHGGPYARATDQQNFITQYLVNNGYVSLVAAYKTPERFKCAVSFAGVANLTELVERSYNFQFGRLSVARIQSGKDLVANSPIEHVDKMRIPLLIVHGDVDTTVEVEQSRELSAALAKAGKPFEYIEQVNGDHYYSLQSHRVEYLTALDRFLQTHLH